MIKTINGQTLERSNIISVTSHWANNVGKTLRDLLARYTNTNREESILKQYGRWFLTNEPDANGMINFNDCTLLLKDYDNKISLEQVKSSASNNCYFQIPITLNFEVDADARSRLRLFLTTIFAGNTNARLVNLAMESLVWKGVELP